MRARIAAAAARLMAEDGVDDFSLAKRKAARQLGAESTQALPDNDEIEAALRSHQSLYQGEEQRERTDLLRELALEAMLALAALRPYLCGAVLKGTAGRYSDIELQLFTDDSRGWNCTCSITNSPIKSRTSGTGSAISRATSRCCV